MKTICLVRHAKSSWKNVDAADFERPLNKRGERDAPNMAELLKNQLNGVDLLMSSPALRAISTAKYFAATLGYPESMIKTDLEFYEGGAKQVLAILKNIDNRYSKVMFFGHNPYITSLASYFSGAYIDNMPTCCVVYIEFNIDTWDDLGNKIGKLVFFEYPKKHTFPDSDD